jgi:hypothetical protein
MFQISWATVLRWRSAPLTCSQMAALRHHPPARRGDGANGRAGVKALANAPGAALFLHVVLQVAARHVQAHGVAVDVLQRIGRLDVFAALANGHHQFDLVVQVGVRLG